MSSELPIGWGDRNVSDYSEPEGHTGDWTCYSMQKKYLSMEVKNNDSSVPVGWVSRGNNLTLSELSNSKNSTAIAVAELTAMSDSNATNSLFVDVKNTKKLNNNSSNFNNSNSIKLNEDNSNINEGLTNINQMVSMLAGAFVQMDSRIKSMEDKLNFLYSRTDEMYEMQKKIYEQISKK